MSLYCEPALKVDAIPMHIKESNKYVEGEIVSSLLKWRPLGQLAEKSFL